MGVFEKIENARKNYSKNAKYTIILCYAFLLNCLVNKKTIKLIPIALIYDKYMHLSHSSAKLLNTFVFSK